MHLFTTIEQGEFLHRPNRFIATCLVKGETVDAFLPNPGRLAELLLPGVMLYLEKNTSASRRLAYTVAAVQREGRPVMVHTHKTNDIAQYLIERSLVPGLEGAQIVKREVTAGRSRFDFLLEHEAQYVYLEVKSCTLFSERVAMFPDAVTARGKKHVEELARLGSLPHTATPIEIRTRARKAAIENQAKALRKETGAVLFIVHTQQVDTFLPEYHTDPAFARALYEARHSLNIIALSLGYDRQLAIMKEVKPLAIPWEVVAQEAGDRGCYLCILLLARETAITIKSLGPVLFRPGYYVYTGRARKGLAKRMERHRRRRKQFFWHIDYLREAGEIIALLPIYTEDDIECELAAAVRSLSQWTIPSFGSSDCSCGSHLAGMQRNPLNMAEFHRLLHYYRMDRPVSLKRHDGR